MEAAPLPPHAEVERIHEAARALCEENEADDERSSVQNAAECPWGSRKDFFLRLTSFCVSAFAELDANQTVAPAIKEEVTACLKQWQASLRLEHSSWSQEDRDDWFETLRDNGFSPFLGLDEVAEGAAAE